MPYTYETALAFLNGARTQKTKQYGRPLQNNTWMVHARFEGRDCIGVLLHATVVVAYLPDGTYVLNSGGWITSTTSNRINSYSPARVGSSSQQPIRLPSGDIWEKPQIPPTVETFENGLGYSIQRTVSHQVWALGQVLAHTTPKIRKCRTCKGVGYHTHTDDRMRWFCDDTDHCVDRQEKITTWNADYSKSTVVGTYLSSCYGHNAVRPEPIVTTSACRRCNGTGQADYGSKPIHSAFADGVVVDSDGNVVRYGARPLYAPQPIHINIEETNS